VNTGFDVVTLLSRCVRPAALPLKAAALLVPRTAAAQGDLVYVCVQDEARIAVIDAATRELVRTIDLTALGFSTSAKPHHVVSEPDGSFVYVSLIGDNTVLKLDRDDRVAGRVPIETPGMLSLDAERDRLLVSRSMSAVNPPRRIGIVELPGFDIEEIDVFMPRPHPMFAAGNGYGYTGSLGENQIASIDIESGVVELIDVEGPPHSFVQFAISPDGRTLVGSTEVSGRLLVFDLATPSKPRFVRSIDIGPIAFDPVFSPDGRTVWVPVKGANEIAIVDAQSWSVTHRISDDAFNHPHAIVFSSDGRSAFVSNNGQGMMHGADHAASNAGEHGGTGSVAIIDVGSRGVVASITLGANVTGLGVRARQR
jgi:DNA-binding beta-propeller fold protein YncE